ncbi:MAG: helix-turn-helix transcriptional regulator [Clostridia bacterium]|nr:helix-turn-helix transcriptional regulator [Clostridia bacterium]
MSQLNPTLCENLNRIRLTLLYFGHANVGKSWKGKTPSPDFSRLYYIVSGSAEIYHGKNQTLTLEAGNWYLFPAGFSFEYACQDHFEHIYFHLKLCSVDRMDLLRNCNSPCRLAPKEDPTAFFLHCLSSHDIVDGLKMQQAVYSLLLNFVAENHIKIINYEYSPCVSAAIRYINQNLSVRLTVSEIAENAFVSKSTLEKRFKKELDTSVHDYINDTAMFEAGQLLSKTKLSVLSISEKFGFCDQFYFSKRFKKKFGMTPRDYRKAAPM